MKRIARSPLPLQTEISRRHRTVILFIIALGTFSIGMTEFVSMGLLPLIAGDFQVTEDTAGYAISAYALGVVVGSPLIAIFTGKIPRRRLLILIMTAVTVGNAMAVIAWNFPTLIIARFLAGFPHGAFFSVSMLCVVSITPPAERGRAIARVSLGFSAAALAGVPALQWLGQHTHWTAAYLVVAACGVITTGALFVAMPHMTRMLPTSPLVELGALANRQVILTVLTGMVGFGGLFAVYTYIGWTLTDVTRAAMPMTWIPFVLMAYGVGGALGNIVGGWIADRNLDVGIGAVLAAIAGALAGFYFTSGNPYAGALNFALVGLCAAAFVVLLQIRLMDVAGSAQTLAAALNHASLNVANATGATIGGIVIAHGYGYNAPAVAGALLSVGGLAVWMVALALRGGEKGHGENGRGVKGRGKKRRGARVVDSGAPARKG